MDSCDWSQTRFDEIKTEMSSMLQQVGMKPKKIPFIPYSGFNGDNLTEPTDKMPWYDGWAANINPTTQIKGVTLLDALEKFVTPPTRNIDAPLRIPVSGVYNIKGVGAIITGRIEQGVAKVDDPLSFAPITSQVVRCFLWKCIIRNLQNVCLVIILVCLLRVL